MAGPEERASRGEGNLRFTITPLSDFYDDKDPRYASEAFELQHAVKREMPDLVEVRAAHGEKGLLSELIVDIVTSGSLTALVEIFKAWLAARPAHRKIDLKFEIDQQKGKRTGTLQIDASNVDSQQLAEISAEAFKSRG